jgi:integrase/recombinase XerD
MASVRRCGGACDFTAALVDGSGEVIPIPSEYLAYVSLRGCSPNTVLGYAYDLAHVWRFFGGVGLSWDQLTPRRSLELLVYFRALPSKRRVAAAGPILATSYAEPLEPRRLSPAAINRALAAVSAFYDWAILCGPFDGPNPITRITERSIMMVSERHQPLLAGIAALSPSARTMRIRTSCRLPRPLDPEQVARLLPELRSRRDLAMVRLMLDGGQWPGEVLGLHLADVSYGRRRVSFATVTIIRAVLDPSRVRSESWTCMRQ